MALIPRSRQVRFAAFIGRPDGATWEDVTDALVSAEINLGDTSGIGTGQTGADSCVRSANITFRSSRIMVDAKFDTSSADEATVIGDETTVVGDSEDPGVKVLNAIFPGTTTFHPGDSLHPLDKNSPRNQFSGQYSALIAPGREIVLKYAIANVGSTVQPVDYKLLFHGIIGDEIRDEGGAIISIQCRDLTKRIQDAYIETVRPYGSVAGTLPEVVIEQILADNMGDMAPPLTVLSDTTTAAFRVKPYQLEYCSAWDGITGVATALGWWLGYKYDTSTDSFKLTLVEPPRNKTDIDHTLLWTDDFHSQSLSMSDRSIRNAISVTYKNAQNGSVETVTKADADSILKYGRRAMQICEAEASLIDTNEEATAFANAALSDLKDIVATANIEMPFAPFIDLFTTLEIVDPRIHTESAFVAVNSISHRFEYSGDKLTARTTVSGCERVVGGFQKWLVMQTRPGAPGQPINGSKVTSRVVIPKVTFDHNPLVSEDMGIDGAQTYAVVKWSKPAGEYFPDSYIVKYKPQTETRWSMAVIRDTEIKLPALAPGTDYHCFVIPVSFEGVEGEVSDSLTFTTPENGAGGGSTPPAIPSNAPTLLIGKKLLSVVLAGSESPNIKHYVIERCEVSADWDSANNMWVAPVSPTWSEWGPVVSVKSTVWQDSSVVYNKAYKYRYYAVNEADQLSGTSNESAVAVPSQIGEQDLAVKSIHADKYYEIRNTMVYNHADCLYNDGVSEHKGIRFDFYIPSETTNIVSVKLSAKGLPFRAYAKTAEASGGHSHSVDLTHSHTGIAQSTGSHSHTWSFSKLLSGNSETITVSGSTGNDGLHSHVVSAYSFDSTRTSSDAATHTHALVYGIYEGTTPNAVWIGYWNSSLQNGFPFGQRNAPDEATPWDICTELDMTQLFSGTGWKQIWFDSYRLGRISFQLVVKVDLSA